MKKQTTYISFGHDHVHIINGIIFDKDCVALIEDVSPPEGREIAFELFGKRFCFEYPEKHFNKESLKYYPRGLIRVPRDSFSDEI
jgi:hypothetical protein